MFSKQIQIFTKNIKRCYFPRKFFAENTKPEILAKLSALTLPFEQKEQKNIYNDYIAFNTKVDLKYLNAQYKLYKINIFTWITIGTLVFIYVHPIASFIPAWIASGNMHPLFLAYKYSRKNVSKITLSQNNPEIINIVLALKEKEIQCQVKNIELKNFEEIYVEKKPKYVISFDVTSLQNKKIQDLKIFLDSEHMRVENFQLFKYILSSDVEKIKSMTYVKKEEKNENEREQKN